MYDHLKRARNKLCPKHVYTTNTCGLNERPGSVGVGDREKLHQCRGLSHGKEYRLASDPLRSVTRGRTDNNGAGWQESPLLVSLLRSCLLSGLDTLWDDDSLVETRAPFLLRQLLGCRGMFRPSQILPQLAVLRCGSGLGSHARLDGLCKMTMGNITSDKLLADMTAVFDVLNNLSSLNGHDTKDDPARKESPSLEVAHAVNEDNRPIITKVADGIPSAPPMECNRDEIRPEEDAYFDEEAVLCRKECLHQDQPCLQLSGVSTERELFPGSGPWHPKIASTSDSVALKTYQDIAWSQKPVQENQCNGAAHFWSATCVKNDISRRIVISSTHCDETRENQNTLNRCQYEEHAKDLGAGSNTRHEKLELGCSESFCMKENQLEYAALYDSQSDKGYFTGKALRDERHSLPTWSDAFLQNSSQARRDAEVKLGLDGLSTSNVVGCEDKALKDSFYRDQASRITYNTEPRTSSNGGATSFVVSHGVNKKGRVGAKTKMIPLDFNLNAVYKSAGEGGTMPGSGPASPGPSHQEHTFTRDHTDPGCSRNPDDPTRRISQQLESKSGLSLQRNAHPWRHHGPSLSSLWPYVATASLAVGLTASASFGLNALPAFKILWDTILQTALVALLLVIVLLAMEANNLTDVVSHRLVALVTGFRQLTTRKEEMSQDSCPLAQDHTEQVSDCLGDVMEKELTNAQFEKNASFPSDGHLKEQPERTQIIALPQRPPDKTRVSQDTDNPVSVTPNECPMEPSSQLSQTETIQCQSSSTQTDYGMILSSDEEGSLDLRVIGVTPAGGLVDASVQADADAHKVYVRTERMQRRHQGSIRKMQKRFLAIRRRCQMEAKDMKMEDRLKTEFLSRLQISIPNLQKEKTALMAERATLEKQFEEEKRKNRELVGRLTKLNQQFYRLGKLQQPPPAINWRVSSSQTSNITLLGRPATEATQHSKLSTATGLPSSLKSADLLLPRQQVMPTTLSAGQAIGESHLSSRAKLARLPSSQPVEATFSGSKLQQQTLMSSQTKIQTGLSNQKPIDSYQQQPAATQQQQSQRLPIFQLFNKSFTAQTQQDSSHHFMSLSRQRTQPQLPVSGIISQAPTTAMYTQFHSMTSNYGLSETTLTGATSSNARPSPTSM